MSTNVPQFYRPKIETLKLGSLISSVTIYMSLLVVFTFLRFHKTKTTTTNFLSLQYLLRLNYTELHLSQKYPWKMPNKCPESGPRLLVGFVIQKETFFRLQSSAIRDHSWLQLTNVSFPVSQFTRNQATEWREILRTRLDLNLTSVANLMHMEAPEKSTSQSQQPTILGYALRGFSVWQNFWLN